MIADAPTGDALRDAVRHVLQSGPPLALAVLFGSVARGSARQDSDVDIAVLPEDSDLPLAAELELQVALTRACGHDVDLVRLDHASTLIAWKVAAQGIPLWEQRKGAFARFQARAAGDYADFAPAFERAGQTFRQRLARGEDRSTKDPAR